MYAIEITKVVIRMWAWGVVGGIGLWGFWYFIGCLFDFCWGIV